MLTEEEKKLYKAWTMIDFQLYYEPLSPCEVRESEKKWLEEMKKIIF